MPVSRTNRVAAGAGNYGPFPVATAPGNGTTEVWTLTIGGTPTGGTFKLKFKGRETAPITWSATNATLVANIDAALEALPGIGTGGVTTAVGTMTAGIGTITLTAAAALAKKNLGTTAFTVAANDLTGTSPTVAVARTTPGVDATLRGAPKGALAVAQDTGKPYSNTGTPESPTWVLTATLST